MSNCRNLERVSLRKGIASRTGMLSLAQAIKLCPQLVRMVDADRYFIGYDDEFKSSEFVDAVAGHPALRERKLFISNKCPIYPAYSRLANLECFNVNDAHAHSHAEPAMELLSTSKKFGASENEEKHAAGG